MLLISKYIHKFCDYKFMIIMLSVLILLFGYNSFIDLSITILLSLFIIVVPLETVFLILLFCTIFDDVLILDFLSGSILRILMILSLLRLIICFIKERKINIEKRDVLFFIFLFIFFIMGFVSNQISSESFTILFNIFLIYLFRIYFMTFETNKKDLYELFVSFFVCASLVACIHGILHFNFLFEQSHDYQIARFMGVFEPNFMSLYIDLALLLVIFNKKIFNDNFRKFLIIMFTVFICMTVSISGIMVMSFIYLIYIFLCKNGILKRILNVSFLAVLSVSLFLLINSSINLLIKYNLNQQNTTNVIFNSIDKFDEKVNFSSDENPILLRIKASIDDIAKGDFDSLTSGRTALIRDFMNASLDRDTIQLLFGNGLETKKLYSKFFCKEKYSHNTYVDFIYNFGFIGFIIIILFFINRTIKGDFMGCCDENVVKNFRLIRLCLLIFGLTLTIYSRRIYLILFLL